MQPNHRLTPKWMTGCAVMGAVVAFLLAAAAVSASDPGVSSAFERQFQKLDFDDVSGHYKLALWCRDQEAWELLKKQCSHVLTLEPQHQQAQLMLELANAKLRAQAPDPGASPDGTSGSDTPTAGGVKLLSDQRVQMVKRELLLLEQQERVRVQFHNDVEERFWNLLAARDNLSDRDRPQYFRQTPAIRAQQILYRIKFHGFDESLREDVEIMDDPLLMKTYITHVWPIIQQGCATAGCHGGNDAKGIALIAGGVMKDATHYTNFMILEEYRQGENLLINRDRPEDSLLLTHGQPPEETEAALRHPTEIRTIYPTPRDPRYRKVCAWLEQLLPPKPDYGFKLERIN